MIRRSSMRKSIRRKPIHRKITGFASWRFGDGFLMRGTWKQYDLLMNRKPARWRADFDRTKT